MAEKDFRELGTPTAASLFSKKVADKVLEYTKSHKPFCEPCCRLEFRDKIEEAEKESERTHGFVKERLDIEVGNLDRFGNADNFELIEDQEDVQDKVIEGSRTQVVIGHTLSYKCKKRGHGISVFIPIAEYNAMNNKKSSKQEYEKKEA